MDQQDLMAAMMRHFYMQSMAAQFAQFATGLDDSDESYEKYDSDDDLYVNNLFDDEEEKKPGDGETPAPAAAPLAQSPPGATGGAGETTRLWKAARGEVSTSDYEGVMRLLRARDGPRACPAAFFSDGAHLCAASRQGILGMVKAFLEQLAVPVNTRDICGRTALHLAAMYGHLHVVRYLLGRGAEVDAKDNIDMTPLLFAAWNDHLDIVKVLTKRGADVNARCRSDEPMKNQRTPLHFVGENGHLEMCRYLVKHGGKVNATTTGGVTPLHTACGLGQVDVVNFLLASGADRSATTTSGATPQDFAVFYCRFPIVQLLQQQRAA